MRLVLRAVPVLVLLLAIAPSYAAGIYNVAADASQDLTFGMARGRTVNIDFTGLAQAFVPYPPTGVLTDSSAFVNLRNVGAMAIGSPEIRRAIVSTAVGQFRWFGAPDSSNLPSYGSQAVVVISAVGLYHMPFGLSVTCPGC